METTTVNIPLKEIVVSGLNDRTVFDQNSLEELASSISKHGILQNLTVRPRPDGSGYELAIGERRLRAAKIANLETVPCRVMKYTDEEFKEVMLIENIQREDIHPLDQAASFARLAETSPEIGALALKVGKSVRYVKERIALNNLTKTGKDLFRNDVMTLGHALILCLLKKDQQNNAIDQVMQNERGFKYFDHPTQLKEWIERNIFCSLSEAVFNIEDENLVKKAGACTSCQKQTGANTELFSEITSEAKCLDKKCFFLKTEVFVSIQNKAMLKIFNLKKEDCPILSNSHYAYNGELNASKWKQVEKPEECATVSVGFLERHNEQPVAVMICTNKTCKVHFAQELKNAPEPTIPENETPAEALSRRLKKRRERELVEDHHTARKQMLDTVAAIKTDMNNLFELGYLIRIMANRSASRALEHAQELGYKLTDEDDYGYNGWIDGFLKFLGKKGPEQLVSFLRKLILLESLSPEDKGIIHRDPADDNLIQHAKSFSIEFKPFLKEAKDARLDEYKAQNDGLKDLVKKEKAKEKAIVSLFENAQEDYPLLYQVVKTKDRVTLLKQQTIEDLSKLVYRIGLKRKADATIDYYAQLISDEVKERLKAMKAKGKS